MTSVARFLVSSIFFHVRISSYFKRAIRLASSYASFSTLKETSNYLSRTIWFCVADLYLLESFLFSNESIFIREGGWSMGLSSLRMKRSLTLNLILTLTVSTVSSHCIADLRKFKVIGRRNIVIIFIAHFFVYNSNSMQISTDT